MIDASEPAAYHHLASSFSIRARSAGGVTLLLHALSKHLSLSLFLAVSILPNRRYSMTHVLTQTTAGYIISSSSLTLSTSPGGV